MGANNAYPLFTKSNRRTERKYDSKFSFTRPTTYRNGVSVDQ